MSEIHTKSQPIEPIRGNSLQFLPKPIPPRKKPTDKTRIIFTQHLQPSKGDLNVSIDEDLKIELDVSRSRKSSIDWGSPITDTPRNSSFNTASSPGKPKIKGVKYLVPALGDSHMINDDEGEVELGIFCINCQEMVPESLIESHSASCVRITEAVSRADTLGDLDSLKLRIEKMDEFLENKDKETIYRPSERNIIAVLKRLCKKLLDSNIANNKDSSSEVMKLIKSMLENFKGSLSLRIYSERLLTISKEQLEALDKIEKIDIEAKMKEVEQLKAQVKIFKERAETIQRTIFKTNPTGLKLDFGQLEDVNSDFSSGKTLSSCQSFRSLVSDERKSEIDLPPDFNDTENLDFPIGNSQEELQKYFYSQCLALKLKYNSRELVKLIPTSKLYEKAVEEKIPVEDWVNFIEEELKHPDKWVKKQSKRSRRSQPTNGNKKFQSFETIAEEDV
ncbi:unnamed protein product [Blepharisma stoltei]|uniref:UBZ4-type domain-containing protein n=1 Tax=Blepharisma stoltei TaxID=1481888 RepID=A0AAU9JVK2_9CILI|nr:unnamed protein product [Blepharisma stoltei]